MRVGTTALLCWLEAVLENKLFVAVVCLRRAFVANKRRRQPPREAQRGRLRRHKGRAAGEAR